MFKVDYHSLIYCIVALKIKSSVCTDSIVYNIEFLLFFIVQKKKVLKRYLCTMFTVALPMVPKAGRNPSIHRWVNEYTKCDIYNGLLFSL